MMRRRMMASIGAKTWVNPYITDGLIAMWDGEWNAGGGVHDTDSVMWKDLAGRNDIFLWNTECQFYENFLKTTASQNCAVLRKINGDYIVTIEAVVRLYGNNGLVVAQFSRLDSGGKWLGFRADGSVNFSSSSSCAFVDSITSIHSYSGVNAFGVFEDSRIRIDGELMITNGHGMSWGGNDVTSINSIATKYSVTDIYCMRIYSRELSADEVAENYAIDKERFGLP